MGRLIAAWFFVLLYTAVVFVSSIQIGPFGSVPHQYTNATDLTD